METLKFLLVSTYFPPHHLGGDATFVNYVSRELVRRGHDVHVYYNPEAYRLFRKGEQKTAHVDDGGVRKHLYHPRLGRADPILALSLGYWRKAQRDLEQVVKETNPDVVHWHNTRGFIGRPFPFDRAMNLYTAHDYTPVCPKSSLLKPGMRLCNDPRWCTVCVMRRAKPPQLWRTGDRRVIRYSEAMKILAPSEFVAGRLREEGVHVHSVLRGFVPDIGAKSLDRSDDCRSMMYMGLLEPHKGLKTLIDAFAMSVKKHDFNLNIIGEGTMRPWILRRSDKGGLKGRVRVPGFLSNDQVAEMRRDTAWSVIPSIWYENAPAVALEALSCGIPVAASDIGGLPEIVTKDAGCELFSPGNVEQLSGLIVRMWMNKDELPSRRLKARAEYERRFSPATHISEYLRIVNG